MIVVAMNMSTTCLFVVLISIYAVNGVELVQRCKEPNYIKCKHLSNKHELWCDDSNMTEVPDPEDIEEGFTDAKFTSLLFMNRSCMIEINVEHLSKYVCLTQLYLDENNIERLPKSPFSKCGGLIVIGLSRNRITAVRSDVFRGLNKLETLDLEGNRIAKLGSKVFRNLPQLRVLRLGNNQLRSIRPDTFQHLPFLEVLDLRLNGLAEFSSEHLWGLTKLSTLHLMNNSLSCLNNDLFTTHDIKELTISNNQLRTPKPKWYQKISRGSPPETGVSITRGNPWVCDCEAIPYMDFLQNHIDDMPLWVEMLDVECSAPQRLGGKMLSKLSREEIESHNNESCSQSRELSDSCKVAKKDERQYEKETRIAAPTPGSFVEANTEFLLVVTMSLLAALVVLIGVVACLLRRKMKGKGEKQQVVLAPPAETRSQREDHNLPARLDQTADGYLLPNCACHPQCLAHPNRNTHGHSVSSGYYSIPDLNAYNSHYYSVPPHMHCGADSRHPYSGQPTCCQHNQQYFNARPCRGRSGACVTCSWSHSDPCDEQSVALGMSTSVAVGLDASQQQQHVELQEKRSETIAPLLGEGEEPSTDVTAESASSHGGST